MTTQSIDILRTNTILYCRRWRSTVRFYRDVIGLAVNLNAGWLVEFELPGRAFLSIADARRASIPSGEGRGVTISLQVRDLESTRAQLSQCGIAVSPTRAVWGARAFYLNDPEGHRIEMWA